LADAGDVEGHFCHDDRMLSARHVARLLAVLQAADLAVTQVSSRYGPSHLDHLGVPRSVQRWLPVIKCAAVAALATTARSPTVRSRTAAPLVAYYSAAVTFHVLSDDPPADAVPAAVCGVLAAWLAIGS
jgi:hypothetical protein